MDHPDTLSLGLIYILKQNLIQTNLPISRRITWIIIIALFQTFKVRDLLTSIFLLQQPTISLQKIWISGQGESVWYCMQHSCCMFSSWKCKVKMHFRGKRFLSMRIDRDSLKSFLKWCRLLFIFKVTNNFMYYAYES